MVTKVHSEHKTISWNGISIVVPCSWEVKATGRQHLNFEKNFHAMLEMRWQKASTKMVNDFIQRSIAQFKNKTGKTLHKTKSLTKDLEVLSSYTVHCYSTNKGSFPQFMFLYNELCSVFLMLQFLHNDKQLHPLFEIKSLKCASIDATTTSWSIQDFRFNVPSTFKLLNHTMDAGFTVLNFNNEKTMLHICRLAPATIRLRQNSMKEILYSLLGLKMDFGTDQDSANEVHYQRSPSLLRQVIFRLQRKNPFLRAKIWHDDVNDRLLGVFMEAVHPIDEVTHNLICSSYEVSLPK